MTEEDITKKHNAAASRVIQIVYNAAVPLMELFEGLYVMLQSNREMYSLKNKAKDEKPKEEKPTEPAA